MLFVSACAAAPPTEPATVDAPQAAQPSTRQRLPNGDRDHDGVTNANDACPLLPEDIDQILDTDGCPEDDADQDGVADADDMCPMEPGFTRVEPGKNGCPYVDRFRVPDEIVIIPRVHFTYGDATTIGADDLTVLDDIALVMKEHPEILKIEVQGDASTDEPEPKKLGESRAKKVLDALVSRGVATERLVAKSYGSERPIADNATTEGRAQNRRVGFLVLEKTP